MVVKLLVNAHMDISLLPRIKNLTELLLEHFVGSVEIPQKFLKGMHIRGDKNDKKGNDSCEKR